jgi:hypothetical protein
MKSKAAFLLLLAAAVASAKTYTVNLYQAARFGEVELAPGEYKLDVNEGKVVIRNGKVHGESPVKVEDGSDKFDRTTVRIDGAGGHNRIQEIRLGGTKTKLVFSM